MLHLKISVFLAVVSLASAWPMVIDAFDAGHCSGKALGAVMKKDNVDKGHEAQDVVPPEARSFRVSGVDNVTAGEWSLAWLGNNCGSLAGVQVNSLPNYWCFTPDMVQDGVCKVTDIILRRAPADPPAPGTTAAIGS